MHIVLRNRESGLFYAGPDKWVRLKEAQRFESSTRAVEVGMGLPSMRLEVLFWFDDPRFNFAVPMGGANRMEKKIPGKSGRYRKA